MPQNSPNPQGQELTATAPASWPSGGMAQVRAHQSPEPTEAMPCLPHPPLPCSGVLAPAETLGGSSFVPAPPPTSPMLSPISCLHFFSSFTFSWHLLPSHQSTTCDQPTYLGHRQESCCAHSRGEAVSSWWAFPKQRQPLSNCVYMIPAPRSPALCLTLRGCQKWRSSSPSSGSWRSQDTQNRGPSLGPTEAEPRRAFTGSGSLKGNT